MYLKRLEMQGFKSFAKKADLSFNNNITIVVGPNGSGKSNIVDAIRWVLGEGSAKSLRGSKMEDVIFSGSTDKKPLGLAQVSLTLDNSSGIFPVDYSEIKITRRLYRSGESEYLINNVRCRQKDIHELIMDTGIGKDSFSIIGQGKVDQILLSQADEKRALIEEVAGISKYRYRKNEAKRKLADTENSLLRVKDIVAELESQKDPLKEQAEKAGEYKEYRKELDELEIKLATFTINSLEEKSEKIIKEKELYFKENIARETLILKDESIVEEKLLSIENLIRESSELQNNIYKINNEINDYQNKKEFSKKMLESLRDSFDKIEVENLKNQNEFEDAIVRKDEEEKIYGKILLEYEEIFSKFKTEEEKINSIKNLEVGSNVQVQEIKSDLFDLAHQLSEIRNNIIDLEKREAVIYSGEEGIKNKVKKSMDFKEIKIKELDNIKIELDMITEEDISLKKEIEKLIEKKDLIFEETKKNEELVKNKTKEMERKLINKQALEALEDNKEGYSAGVKSIFANKNLRGIIGTVADLAETTPEYRLAIETALGGSIQNIVTENEVDAKNAIDYLRENKAGRATFLPLNIISEKNRNKANIQAKKGLKSALDIIKYEEKFSGIFKHLLGSILIAKDMDEALTYNKSLDKMVRIVTLKGEILDSRGSMTGGQYKNNQEGFFLRKEKIKVLNSEITKYEQEIREEEEQLSKSILKIRNIEIEIEKFKEDKLLIEKKKQDIENIINQITFQISETEKDILILNAEENEFVEEKDLLLSDKEKRKEILTALEKEKKEKEATLLKVQKDIEEEKNALFDLEKALGRLEINYNDLKNKKENKEFQLEDINNKIDALTEKRNEIDKEKINLTEKIKELEESEINSKDKIKERELVLHDLEEKLENTKEIKEEEEKEKRLIEEEIRKTRKVFEDVKDMIHTRDITLEKYKTEIESFKENLLERFDILYERSFTGFEEEFNERSSKQKVRELRKKIEELGEVNLIAISEYEKLIERYTFLKTQCADLDEAKDSLVKIIDEMDHIIVKKFKDTYLKLNEAFKETFTDMFNGGTAEIIMTDKDNVLETGIEIIAQPPGKTPKHLSLLSGGEKAMTAICLLFAILKIKPGPFCILDEIEASLDESNVARFAGFLKKFAQITQFVVISHRKGTMEAGDVLYGVTMEEKGISSLISVRISETIKLTS